MPPRPTAGNPQASYEQAIWDAVDSLRRAVSTGRRISTTTRGVIHHADVTQGSGEVGTIEIPEWSNERGWSQGDFVVRSQGIVGPGPWSPNDAVTSGRQTGMWEALEDIIQGGDADGPSLDSTKWRIVAPHATEQFVFAKTSKGLIVIDVGRDGAQRPRILIRDADVAQGGASGEINLDVTLTEGRSMEPLWATFCVRQSDGTNKKMRAKVLMSEPENIPGE